MFPERGEEFACDQLLAILFKTPGIFLWVYSHRQEFERCAQKRLE